MVYGCCANICIFIIYLICPPFAILCDKGCGNDFWINFILTLLGIIPGYIHGAWVLWCQDPPPVYVLHQQQDTARIITE
uniref:UPF0057-domain-containing protein n=1 Tax=Rhabditophanes sp. KR3021 TaxID=114890 RepID=A0AC35U456_9BILA